MKFVRFVHRVCANFEECAIISFEGEVIIYYFFYLLIYFAMKITRYSLDLCRTKDVCIRPFQHTCSLCENGMAPKMTCKMREKLTSTSKLFGSFFGILANLLRDKWLEWPLLRLGVSTFLNPCSTSGPKVSRASSKTGSSMKWALFAKKNHIKNDKIRCYLDCSYIGTNKWFPCIVWRIHLDRHKRQRVSMQKQRKPLIEKWSKAKSIHNVFWRHLK